MADSAREFFESLPSMVDESKTAGMNNSYLFDIEDAGQWVVAVADGKVDVTEGAGDAGTTLRMSEPDFLAMTRGELNSTSAFMTGKLKVSGDMAAAMKLQKLF